MGQREAGSLTIGTRVFVTERTRQRGQTTKCGNALNPRPVRYSPTDRSPIRERDHEKKQEEKDLCLIYQIGT